MRLVVRAVKLPVVAAGGIMDGAGIAAALALGAQAGAARHRVHPLPRERRAAGAQGLAAAGDGRRHARHREVLRQAGARPRQPLHDGNGANDAPQLAFPAQNSVTGKLRQASAKAGKPDFIALWAGQAAPLSRALPAAELIAKLECEKLSNAIQQT